MTQQSLSLYSEPYTSTGNIGANFRRLLGAPSLNCLQTVIRESVQNIADASLGGCGPEVLIRIRTLTPAQRGAMAERMLSQLPEETSSRRKLSAFLADENAKVLEICDFSTCGLGGPTRADRIPVGVSQTDFIDFLRNIGTPRDTELGGGTYGFGKVALYRASKCSTILVDSLPVNDARRLIGCHVGDDFERREGEMRRRFTGRHWWGIPDPLDQIADPATDDLAGELAASIGLPSRESGRTGTSIMVLDFDTEDEPVEVAGRRLVETLLWNFWPRLMEDAPAHKRFRCEVEIEGKQIEVPWPDEYSPLDLFAKAMRAARSGTGNDVRSIESKRPSRHLGRLAFETGLRTQRRPLVASDSLFPDPVHHIALMRPVELVVKYLPGSILPDERLEWAGVFLTSDEDEVERAFADSEPPAHDDWLPDNMPRGPAKTFVRVALRELKYHASEFGNAGAGAGATAVGSSPLAKVSGKLGAALEGVGGDGAGQPRPSGKGGGGRPPRARATTPTFVRLEIEHDRRIAVFRTEVRQDASRSGAALTFDASISVDGSGMTAGDHSAASPEVCAIRSCETGESVSGELVQLDGADGAFEVSVFIPHDSAVVVTATVLEGASQ